MNKVLQKGQQEHPGAETVPGWPRAAALGVSSATSPALVPRCLQREGEERPDRTRGVRDPDRWGLFVFNAGKGCAMAGVPGLDRGTDIGLRGPVNASLLSYTIRG